MASRIFVLFCFNRLIFIYFFEYKTVETHAHAFLTLVASYRHCELSCKITNYLSNCHDSDEINDLSNVFRLENKYSIRNIFTKMCTGWVAAGSLLVR